MLVADIVDFFFNPIFFTPWLFSTVEVEKPSTFCDDEAISQVTKEARKER